MVGIPGDAGAWLKQNYDKLLVVLALVALLGSAVYLLLKISGETADIEAGAWEIRGSKSPAKAVDLSGFESNLVFLAEPFVGSTPTTNVLMVSEIRVVCVNPEQRHKGPIPYEAEICPICNYKQPPVPGPDWDRDGGGCPDRWELRYGFNVKDPRDDLADVDRDGFTNVEEYRGKTDPRNPNSKPPPAIKLRIVKVNFEKFRYLFEGLIETDEGLRFQINEESSGGGIDRSYFKTIGEPVEDYILSRYDEDAVDDEGNVVPTLILTNATHVLPLPKGEKVDTDRYKANLVSLINGQRWNDVSKESELEVQGYTYIVIDIKPKEVLIRDANSNIEVRIKQGTKRESQELRRKLNRRRPDRTAGASRRQPGGGGLQAPP